MSTLKEKLFIIGLAVVALLPLLAPTAAFAAANAVKSNVFNPTILAGPLTVCVGAPSANTGNATFPICNNLCDLIAQVANIIYYAIAVVIWIITPILVAVGGIMIMLSGANPGMIETGKKTITGTVWGVVIVLCAWLIVFTFVSAFGGLSKYVGGFGGNGGQAACSVPGSTNSTGPLTAPNTCGGSNPGSCPTGQTCQVISGSINIGGGPSTAVYGCK